MTLGLEIAIKSQRTRGNMAQIYFVLIQLIILPSVYIFTITDGGCYNERKVL